MAAKKLSSRRPPSKKAGTRTRSTTSSTTARTTDKVPASARSPQTEAVPVAPSRLLAVDIPTSQFDPQQRESFLLLLARGASPSGACKELNISLVTVAELIEQDEEFRKLLARVNELLSQNVAAALYRSAMEGKVTAQTFYVKNWPPPDWSRAEDDPLSRQLNDLTDDELIAQFKKEAPALLADLAAVDAGLASIPDKGANSPPPGSLSKSSHTSRQRRRTTR
ncbi:hypothetical protein SH661x_001702 [Planctomicrobium sp. SH661]|uniref:hypothetical protein n=1 Tax=Planctomicrobium sp. SH661 TaxID=3448124 RepID=UPI003F5BABF2